jgi:hypothetical protein
MVMGYPSFIQDVDAACVKGVGAIDGGETDSIKNAAKSDVAASIDSIPYCRCVNDSVICSNINIS